MKTKIPERQEEINAFVREFWPPKTSSGNPKDNALQIDDEEIIAKARAEKNGKFDRLWRGDLSDYNHDHSAADDGFVHKLWSYTQDEEQIKRIHVASGLSRGKSTNRDDYLQRSIDRARDNVTWFYPWRDEATLPLNGQKEEQAGFTQFTQFDKLPQPLPFPVNAMPKSCRRLIKEGAAAIGCPPNFIGMAMLVALGSAIGNSRRAQVKRGWSEGACIYGGIIAAPGDKKTAAQNLGTEPAIKKEIKLREKYREEVDAYKQEYREWEVQKKTAHKNEEAAPSPPEPPVMKRTVVGDTTVEAMARIRDENPRGVGVFRDELLAWVKAMDQYKAGGKGAERQFWLSTWSNAVAQFDRKAQQEPTIIPRPFACVFGSIQPDMLPELHSNRGDGMLERFAFSYPHPVFSDWTDSDISWEAEVSYSNLYLKLRDLSMSEQDTDNLPEPRFVGFEQDAKELFIAFYNRHQAQRRTPGFPKILHLVWPKLEGYLVRLSLILAMSRFVSEGGSEKIARADVMNAAHLVAYFKNHAYRVYTALYGEDPEDVLAYDLVCFLAKRGGRFRGQPSDLFGAFDSRAKPKSTHWLSHHIKKLSERTAGLYYEEGHEAFQKAGTKTGKSTRRVVELHLENCVNCVNLLEGWMEGVLPQKSPAAGEEAGNEKDAASGEPDEDFEEESYEDSPEGEVIREFLEEPPDWFVRQAKKCIEEGLQERHIKALATAAATELLNTAFKWREVLPIVKDKLEEMSSKNG